MSLFLHQLQNVPHLYAPTPQLHRSIWNGNNDFVSSALTGDQCTLITYQTRGSLHDRNEKHVCLH
jgi:hypothetical protein